MSSYIYPTVFVRNAANLAQLLLKTSKIGNRNENLKYDFRTFFRGLQKDVF
jgi:hypothetical protein